MISKYPFMRLSSELRRKSRFPGLKFAHIAWALGLNLVRVLSGVRPARAAAK
jgi:hypothetical protein